MNVFTNNSRPLRVVRLWTGLSRPIPRHLYALNGFALAGVKYLGDVILVYAATGETWPEFTSVVSVVSNCFASEYAASGDRSRMYR